MRRPLVLGLVLSLVVLGVLGLRAWLDGNRDPGVAAERGPAATAVEPPDVSAEPIAPAAPVSSLQPDQRAAVARAADAPAVTAQVALERGRLLVVEADGLTPRPDFALRAVIVTANEPGRSPDRRVSRQAVLTTDAGGRADMSAELALAPDAELVRFFPSADETLRLEPFELPVAELGTTADAPSVLRLVARGTAPVSAVAVDAATRLALPGVALRVQRWFDLQDDAVPLERVFAQGYLVANRFYDGSDCEWVVTDEAGRFTTERSYPAGRIGFLTIDQERADLQHAVPAGTEAIELEVPVGPLLRLDFTPGAGRVAEDYVGGVWRAPEELVSTDGVQEYPSPWSHDRGRRAGFWGNAVPVQLDDGPYLRLPVDQASEPLPSFVFLLSRDGASFGHAPFTAWDRHVREPLHVPLEERLALAGLLAWPDGVAPDAAAEVTCESRSDPDGSPREVSVDRLRRETETAFQFQALAAGDYRLRVVGDALQELSLDVSLPHEAPVVLRPLAAVRDDLHAFALRVVTESGQPLDGEQGRAHLRNVYLWPGPGANRSFKNANLTWEGGAGSAVYQGLEAGTYAIMIGWERGAHPVLPQSAQVEVPGPELELTVRDALPTVRLQVRLIDPPDQGSLVVSAQGPSNSRVNEYFRIRAEDPRLLLPDGRPSLEFRAGPFGADFELALRLESEQHRIVMLKDSDIGPPDEEGLRVVEIVSRPGWFARITTWAVTSSEGEGRVPLPGIVLTLDGMEQPPTDQFGVLVLSLDEQPQRLGVATPGWRLVTRTSWDDWGSVFADTGAFTVEGGYLDVFLERRDD